MAFSQAVIFMTSNLGAAEMSYAPLAIGLTLPPIQWFAD